jgi:hypothetical protein
LGNGATEKEAQLQAGRLQEAKAIVSGAGSRSNSTAPDNDAKVDDLRRRRNTTADV